MKSVRLVQNIGQLDYPLQDTTTFLITIDSYLPPLSKLKRNGLVFVLTKFGSNVGGKLYSYEAKIIEGFSLARRTNKDMSDGVMYDVHLPPSTNKTELNWDWLNTSFVEGIFTGKAHTKKNEDFINESNLKFTDISSEKEREYIKYDKTLKLDGEPMYLNVSKSGGHRLYTDEGWCYYVQPNEGWAIRWKVKEGKPSFVK